jgi:glycosyltransferase involved in cell wall biosynthesis
MRILHISNHRERYNGMVTATIDLACELSDLGNDVAFCSGPGDFRNLLEKHNVKIFYLDRLVTVTSAPVSGLHIWLAVKEFKPDVIHTHMTKVSLLTWPIAKLTRTPFVTCVHNSFSRHAVLMTVGDLVITGCRAEVELMVSRGIPARKSRPVLNGTIGSARQSAASKEADHKQGVGSSRVTIKRPAVITACGLHPRKGVPDLIAGFKMASAQLPDLNLYIFGGGPNEAEYKDLAARDGASNIIFCGQAPVLRPFFDADVFVLASLADPAPLAISEAREAGLAVIATNVPGVPELLEHGKAGILVEPRSPPEIAKQLTLLFTDRNRLNLWRKNSQFRIDHLSMSRVAAETMNVYQECIGMHAGRFSSAVPTHLKISIIETYITIIVLPFRAARNRDGAIGVAVNHQQKQRGRGKGRPFTRGHSGNPAGRPMGSRNAATETAQALLDGEAGA